MAGWTAATLAPQATKGGVTRQAFSVPQPVTSRGSLVAPAVATPATTPSNVPAFLQGGAGANDNIMELISEILGLTQPKTDPELVKAQTILAQQQAMQTARENQVAREQEVQQAGMDYLRSQMKDAAKYTTGSVGNILMQRYSDRAKTLQNEGTLNWLNMPASSYSVPRRSGWTGPAMPGTWGL